MIIFPLPDEHVYSYLYRSYRIHGVINAMHTIINGDGFFRQRIALIPYDYIQVLLPESPDMTCEDNDNVMNFGAMLKNCENLWWNRLIAPVLYRSGFMLREVLYPSSDEVLRGKGKPGLRVSARVSDKRMPERIKYCPLCVHVAIRTYGTAYLSALWLGNATHCPKCLSELVVAETGSRRIAIRVLEQIFSGKCSTG